MKLAVIGGGGVRSMFLAKSIAGRALNMGIDDLVFMDTDEEKLNIYGNMAKEVAKRICPSLKFSLTTNSIDAIKNADFIITTIRVGGDSMRCRDERIALNHGVIGQETTGAAGFSFAMRSIPALKKYCEETRKYAKKGAKIFNFTNPAGIVSQALRDMGYDFAYGICDAPTGMIHRFEELYDLKENQLQSVCYGLNHLSFFKEIKLNGENIIPKIVSDKNAYKNTDLRYFDREFLMKKQFVPNEYLYYFYNREKALKNIISAKMTRGEQIEKINKLMTAELKNIDIALDFETALKIFDKYYGMREDSYMASETGEKRNSTYHFDMFSHDDGGYAGVALSIIDAEKTNSKNAVICCTPNRDKALDFLEESDIIECSCIMENGIPKPLKIRDVPFENEEIIRRVKSYERLGAKAIINCQKDLAVDALYLHPLVSSYSLAEELLDEYLELNREYLGEWK